MATPTGWVVGDSIFGYNDEYYTEEGGICEPIEYFSSEEEALARLHERNYQDIKNVGNPVQYLPAYADCYSEGNRTEEVLDIELEDWLKKLKDAGVEIPDGIVDVEEDVFFLDKLDEWIESDKKEWSEEQKRAVYWDLSVPMCAIVPVTAPP